MRTFTAVSNTTIYDVCLNTYGTLDLLVKLMVDNNFPSINDYPAAGQKFIFDENLVVDQIIYNRLAAASVDGRATELGKLLYATRFQQVGTDSNPDDNMPYEKSLTAEYTAAADGETVIILLPLAGVGARIIQIERELKPMFAADFSFNPNVGQITLLNGVAMASGETLFIIYAIKITD